MPETELSIRIFGDPTLRKKSKAVAKVLSRHGEILSRMARLMYDLGGIGLAAPQVGLNEAMIVVDTGKGLYKLINPLILEKQGTQEIEEGCLSVPGVCLKVRRAWKIIVQALDESGSPQKIEAEGLLACVFQHEIDHLQGKLIVDHASVWGRLKIRKQLEILNERARNEKLPKSETKSCKLQL